MEPGRTPRIRGLAILAGALSINRMYWICIDHHRDARRRKPLDPRSSTGSTRAHLNCPDPRERPSMTEIRRDVYRPTAGDEHTVTRTTTDPWLALWALCLGFFMIVMDTTIVAVANPAILMGLHTDISSVIWVTSAYLLTFAVPLLITGRLGDRFGPKNLYLIGLTVFTLASLWCGVSGSIAALIAARTVQGLGAALITPQTMAIITRSFPSDKRGAAMGAWSAVAGIATLVGPIAGGVLIDALGWEWIFFVNVPVGLIAFVLAVWFVPTLPTHQHRFDILGVVLSAIGTFLLVFGIQEGNNDDWSAQIWTLIGGGFAVLVGFVYWQYRQTGEPLVPLGLFRIRNFALANLGIGAMQAAITALTLPAFFYLEAVREMSPTMSALVFTPMAIVAGFLAPAVGRLVDKTHPRNAPAFGFATMALGVICIALRWDLSTPVWQLIVLIALMGVAMACIWAPLGAIAIHDLPIHQAGAGSGVYNTTRQVGSVLGSAAISALITTRMAAQGITAWSSHERPGPLSVLVRTAFNTALAQSMLLVAGLLAVGFLASIFFGTHNNAKDTVATTTPPAAPRIPARSWPSTTPASTDTANEEITS